MKKIISFALAAVVVLTFSVPTLAVPDKDGWFSTPVLEEGTTWLTVDIIDTYSGNGSAAVFRPYFGIMNGVILATGKPLFEPGSTFSVCILSQDSFE